MYLFANRFGCWFISVILVICTISCSQPKQEIKKNEEVIKETLIQMWDAIENEDLDRYASYIHPNFTQFGEFDDKLKIGKEAEVKGVQDWVNSSDNIQTEMIDPLVTVKGNVAWITYYWSDSGITEEKTFSSTGKSTRIFVKENGKWLCIHGHYTILTQN
jgi:ketosteroid isomerase-like protein